MIISTSTASGKTLCFNIPVLESIIRDPNSRALYIYPTKALAQDQIRQIAKFRDDYPAGEEDYKSGYYFTMNVGGRKIYFGKYEGPTPRWAKRKIEEFCNIVLTNPDELHFGILRFNNKWTSFLKNLRYVIMDEVHIYRGIFGSNVSLVIRRLRKLCEVLGARPRFILCSATIPNALEHAQRLTGCKDFAVIEEDGSPRKKRVLILWNPPLKDPRTGEREEPLTNIVDLITEAIMERDRVLKTIVFGRSRRSVKLAYRLTGLRLEERKRRDLMKLVREYTATLLPERREEILSDLIGNKACIIIGTNALELGIDVPEMSCYLSIGYPGRMTSVYQQFGRVGRSGEGVGIIVLYNQPLEQYFARNPKEFFDRKPEEVAINPANPELLRMHLACCIYELDRYGGLKDEDIRRIFGSEAENCKKQLAEKGKILEERGIQGACWRFNYEDYDPSKEYLSIRNPLSSNNFTIKCGERKVGVIDSATVIRDLHPKAIWTDNDRQYEVLGIDFDRYEVHVREVEVDYYTFSVPEDSISIIRREKEMRMGNATLTFGKIKVKRRVQKYCKVIPGEDREESRWEEIPWSTPIPEYISTFTTDAIWLTLPYRLAETNCTFEDGLHAIEHAILAMAPKWVSCDPNDIGGSYQLNHHGDGIKPTIFIYDNYPGGVGLTKACYKNFRNIIKDCIKLLETCSCKSITGCPSCIQLSRCPKRNEKLNKEKALEILRKLINDKDYEKQRIKLRLARAPELIKAITKNVHEAIKEKIPYNLFLRLIAGEEDAIYELLWKYGYSPVIAEGKYPLFSINEKKKDELLKKISDLIFQNLDPKIPRESWKRTEAPIYEDEISKLLFNQGGSYVTLHSLLQKITPEWKEITLQIGRSA